MVRSVSPSETKHSTAERAVNCPDLTLTLPNEILSDVLVELDVPSLCNASRVCRRWHDLISENDSLWKQLCSCHCPGDRRVRHDRQKLGLSWRAAFVRNYGAVGIKRKWREGEYSSVRSFSELPAKSMCVMDAETWGEIFQNELDRHTS